MLAEIRDAAGMTQRQVAERMSANQTRISRIEAGDGDDTDIASFLDALGTPRARSFADLLKVEWLRLPRPSLRHPDLDALAGC
jgi:transcriptional regulator with XRE-family HTH domain